MNNPVSRVAICTGVAIESNNYVVHESQELPTNNFTMAKLETYLRNVSITLRKMIMRFSQHSRQIHPDSTDPPLKEYLYGTNE